MTEASVNLTAEEKRRVIDKLFLQLLARAGIHTEVEPTPTGMTLHIDLQKNIALPPHLARFTESR